MGGLVGEKRGANRANRDIYVDYVMREPDWDRGVERATHALSLMRRISGEIWRWESGVSPPLAEGGCLIHR